MNLSTSLLQSLSGIGGDAPGEKLNKSGRGFTTSGSFLYPKYC